MKLIYRIRTIEELNNDPNVRFNDERHFTNGRRSIGTSNLGVIESYCTSTVGDIDALLDRWKYLLEKVEVTE